jgi:hypothetical protein
MNFLFHRHVLSRVFTIRGRSYQVCLLCTREFLYDLHAMKQVPERGKKQPKLQIVARRA